MRDRRWIESVMDKKVLIVLILYGSILSHGLILQKSVRDLTNFYEVDTVKEFDERPVTDYLKKNEDNSDLSYIILVPKNSQDYKILLGKSEADNKYVIIRSKPKLLELGPYSLIQRLDKSKHMVMWLNLYCEMHPDCDINKLKEELMKVRPYLEL